MTTIELWLPVSDAARVTLFNPTNSLPSYVLSYSNAVSLTSNEQGTVSFSDLTDDKFPEWDGTMNMYRVKFNVQFARVLSEAERKFTARVDTLGGGEHTFHYLDGVYAQGFNGAGFVYAGSLRRAPLCM
jgi:hypothetical protein